MILHITTRNDWEKAVAAGVYTTDSLITEGFIHCSTLKQTADTANLFFKGQHGLILLCIDEDKLIPECKYENPTATGLHNPEIDNLFPHIYGPINLSAVMQVVEFPAGENGFFALPEKVFI